MCSLNPGKPFREIVTVCRHNDVAAVRQHAQCGIDVRRCVDINHEGPGRGRRKFVRLRAVEQGEGLATDGDRPKARNTCGWRGGQVRKRPPPKGDGRIGHARVEHDMRADLGHAHFGPIIFSGRTTASNVASSTKPRAMASSLRVVPFLWAVFATVVALS